MPFNPDDDENIRKAKQRFSIIGNNPAFLAAIDRAMKVAPIDLSVLVTGESGAGKEFFPKIIHNFGARKHKKYIAVNCGAIPEGTIDSELFGHEKGSFTGALSARTGYFEEADGGTVFLDEVAELPLTTQARLLRVLETGEFLKVGSSTVQKTDIRIVAATNVDLIKAVEKGKFREDLYYRLSTVVITVPPLRERGEDIILLARKFAADFSEKYLTAPITLSDDARRAMMLYRWPGNVRQLKNIVEQLALFDAGTEISRRTILEALPSGEDLFKTPAIAHPEHSYEREREFLWQSLLSIKAELSELKKELHHGEQPVRNYPRGAKTPTSLIKYNADDADDTFCTPLVIDDEDSAGDTETPISLEESERETIAAALRQNDGDKKKTAAQLDISLRTLYRKIRELGLTQ